MKNIADFLVDMSDDMPMAVADEATGEGLAVDGFEISVPIESSTDDVGELAVSLPRGRLATGFDLPHGKLTATFIRGEGE